MAERLSESEAFESTTVGIYRTAATVKGGRRFSFSALVVVGDRRGRVGLGYGKAPGVPAAIEKAQKDARKNVMKVGLKEGTLPHASEARFGASRIRLLPAAPGTGVIAGGTARAVLELAGVRDCLTKSFGSNNQKNLARAVMVGLTSLRSKEDVAKLRGVEIDKTDVEERLELGERFHPKPVEREAQVLTVPETKKEEKKPAEAEATEAATAVAEAPAEEKAETTTEPAAESPAEGASSEEESK